MMQTSTFLILSALAEGASDSAELLVRLRRLSAEDAPSLATFYRRLKEALDEGWVEVSVTAAAAGPGRPSQIYHLTERGRAAVRAEARRWRALSDRVLRGEEPAG